MPKVCVAGTTGKTSLIYRMLYNEFQLHYPPTEFITIHKLPEWQIIEVPEHAKPINCDMLILCCKSQIEVMDTARRWFGYHKHLFVALIDAEPENPLLCPKPHIVHVDNVACTGIQQLLSVICVYK